MTDEKDEVKISVTGFYPGELFIRGSYIYLLDYRFIVSESVEMDENGEGEIKIYKERVDS